MIWGAFANACQGMNAMSTDMGSISQNIANMNTTAYKKTETRFSTVMSESHAAPSTHSGRLNIFGVQTSQRNLIDIQGSILDSNSDTDLAINGDGFFMVAPSTDGTIPTEPSVDNPQQVLYTRAGNFSFASGADGERYFTVGGNYLLGWMADETGAIDETGDLTALYSRPQVTIEGNQTTAVSVKANIPAFSALADPATGDPATRQKISVPIFDNEFREHTLTFGFERTGTDTWNLLINSGEGDQTTYSSTPIEVTFNENGRISTEMPLDLSFEWEIYDADGNVVGTTTADIAADFSNLTQYDADATSVGSTEQDGYGAGLIKSAGFNTQGEYVGTFDNGQTRTLFKVPIATFVAQNSLEPVSGTMFRRTGEAGEITVAGLNKQSGTTQMISGALEGSNVSVEDEFTRMIMTQKAYTSNSQVFKTADEMITTARDLKA